MHIGSDTLGAKGQFHEILKAYNNALADLWKENSEDANPWDAELIDAVYEDLSSLWNLSDRAVKRLP